MKCHNCNSDIRDDAVFCSECGTKVPDNIEEKLEIVTEDIENKSSQKISLEKNNNNENDEKNIAQCSNINFSQKTNKIKKYLEKLKEKKSPVKLYLIIATYVFIFIFLFGSLASKLGPNKNVTTFVNGGASKNTQNIKNSKLKEIHILDEEYNIVPGQVETVNYYTYPENVNISELKWQSSNSNIKVNQRGYISSNKPNEEGIITISNLDGTIKEQCKVKVLTNKEAFLNTMDYINNKDIEAQKEVNLYIDKFKLGNRASIDKRKVTLDVFTKINIEMSSYKIIQKQFVNSETKNIMDCDVYIDSNTGDIRKIVTIEYLKGNLEITDYYYMDGNIYFIFKRNENYYRPIPAQQDFPGSRYYYYQDSLLKWREIKKESNDTFEKTDYNYNNKEFQWKTYAYKNLDDVEKEKSNYTKAKEDSKLQKQWEEEFIKKEKNMLNAAYNIYNKVAQSPRITNLTGYVLDNSGQPMSGVRVKVFSEQYKLLVGETTTNNEGLYKIPVPVDSSIYTVYISKPGYVETTIYEVDPTLGTSNLFQENVYMYAKSDMIYNVKLNLINALNGNSLNVNEIQGTRIIIRRGINNKKGPIERELQLNNNYDPIYNIELSPGNYTAEVISPGRENSYFTISTLIDNMQVYSNIVPKITDDSVRVVLSWGEKPSDLDSHLFLPNNKHIAYYSREVENGYLDVDDTTSYGPETITLNKLEKETYKYYVSDFTNCSSGNYSSMDMSNSFARVDVYTKNGLAASFTVPNNRQGVIWHVFNISNGKIIPIQRYFNNIEDMEWWATGKCN